jgi:hypothetical protein
MSIKWLPESYAVIEVTAAHPHLGQGDVRGRIHRAANNGDIASKTGDWHGSAYRLVRLDQVMKLFESSKNKKPGPIAFSVTEIGAEKMPPAATAQDALFEHLADWLRTGKKKEKRTGLKDEAKRFRHDRLNANEFEAVLKRLQASPVTSDLVYHAEDGRPKKSPPR